MTHRFDAPICDVTDQRMEPVKKLFSNLKDAFACFGPAVLMHRHKRGG